MSTPNTLKEKFDLFKEKLEEVLPDYRRWTALGILLALLIALPITVWGFSTARFETRKRAATGEVTPTPILTPTPTPIPGGYTLQPYPSGNIFLSHPSSGYVIRALLKDANGQLVTNQRDFSYRWTIDKPAIAKISPFPDCIFGIQPPCPKEAAKIQTRSAGSALIEVTVTQKSTRKLVASLVFKLYVSQILPTPTPTPTPTSIPLSP